MVSISLAFWLLVTAGCVSGMALDDSDLESEQSDAQIEPKFLSKEGVHEVSAGGTVTFDCMVQDVGGFSVNWYKVVPNFVEDFQQDDAGGDAGDVSNPGPLLFADDVKMTNDDRYDIVVDSNIQNSVGSVVYTLQLSGVTAYDSGPYECQVSSTPPLRQRQVLTVNVPPKVKIEPDSKPYSVYSNELMTLSCISSGFPEPNVTWTKKNGPLPGGRLRYTAKGRADLSYDRVNFTYQGIYVCEAENSVGTHTAEIEVKVYDFDAEQREAPTIRADSKIVLVDEGDSATLMCNYTGSPSLNFHWSHQNFPVTSTTEKFDGRLRMEYSHPDPDNEVITATLKIRNIVKTDFGEYVCKVSNNVGSASDIIFMSGHPGIPYAFSANVFDDRIEFSWRVESVAPITKYELLYRQPNLSNSLHIKVPASDGRRINEKEFLATYTLFYNPKMFQANTKYEFFVQGHNKHGKGSMTTRPLEVMTPEKMVISSKHDPRKQNDTPDLENSARSYKNQREKPESGTVSLLSSISVVILSTLAARLFTSL